MSILVLLFAICGSSGMRDAPEYVDKIELNTVEGEGNKFRQVIFWKWYPEYGEYHPAAWALLDGYAKNTEKFEPTLRNGKWYGRYYGYNGKVYSAYSNVFEETRTEYDRELHDKKRLPDEMRRTLHGMDYIEPRRRP